MCHPLSGSCQYKGETGIFGSALVSTPGEPWPPDTSTTKKLCNVLTSISSTAVFGKTWGEVTERLLEQDARPLNRMLGPCLGAPSCRLQSAAVPTWSFSAHWCPLASAKFLHRTPYPGLEAATVPSLPTESSKISDIQVRGFLFLLLFASSVEKPDFYFVSFISESLRLCVCLWL